MKEHIWSTFPSHSGAGVPLLPLLFAASIMLSDTGAELWLGAVPVSIWLMVSLTCAAAESPAIHIRAAWTLWSHRERLAGLQQERRHQLGTLLGAVKREDMRDKGQEAVIVLETQNRSETESLGLEKVVGRSRWVCWDRRDDVLGVPPHLLA